MNTNTTTFEFPTFTALTRAVVNRTTNVFAPETSFSTADFLLRVASHRQYVRALQALRRR